MSYCSCSQLHQVIIQQPYTAVRHESSHSSMPEKRALESYLAERHWFWIRLNVDLQTTSSITEPKHGNASTTPRRRSETIGFKLDRIFIVPVLAVQIPSILLIANYDPLHRSAHKAVYVNQDFSYLKVRLRCSESS